jgi:hypothetical protein
MIGRVWGLSCLTLAVLVFLAGCQVGAADRHTTTASSSKASPRANQKSGPDHPGQERRRGCRRDSPNTAKSYIRIIYREINVASRTEAVLWGVSHGFISDHHRIEHGRGGP